MEERRKIRIELETDSFADIDLIKRDLQTEIDCCITFFDTENMTVEEVESGDWSFIGNNLYACINCGYMAESYWLHKWQMKTTDSYFPDFCPKCGKKKGRKENDKKQSRNEG